MKKIKPIEKIKKIVLRFNDLEKEFGLSRSTVDRLEKSGLFPKRINLGENSIGWLSEEIEQWLQNRINAREG